ncbi:hypothetical protein [Corynebacterium sp.]|uniref:hypothetical protein n=1 Tax=Corynebacterium sp. TaxID=1720 RepID=UPI0026DD979A|nr:hypothetical protein [Corynebacterium sp.]MDO4609232.1 hypothetical protein [Corynebacterium sp.]
MTVPRPGDTRPNHTAKSILAILAIALGVVAFILPAIIWGAGAIIPGLLLGAGIILPAAWWLGHDRREARAAVDPDAPAAVMDRRWRFVAPAAAMLALFGLGGIGITVNGVPEIAGFTEWKPEKTEETTAPSPESSSETSQTTDTQTTDTWTTETTTSMTTTAETTTDTSTSETTTDTPTETPEPSSDQPTPTSPTGPSPTAPSTTDTTTSETTTETTSTGNGAVSMRPEDNGAHPAHAG